MLQDATLYTVLAAKDIERLKNFLADKLGLEPVDEEMGIYFYEVGGGKMFIYESTYAGTNQATAASFDVADIAATVEALRGKGVEFEHYDLPRTTREGDIHVMEGANLKSAWFTDTEGNILNLNQST